jgi:hypothetical protein
MSWGRICVWEGCSERISGDLPKGWSNLVLYGSPQPRLNLETVPPQDWLHDGVLCPKHTRRLEEQLKDIGRALDAPAAAEA